MWILRLVLIVLGVVFIIGVYWYTRRHPPRRKVGESRIEPAFIPERAVMPEAETVTEAAGAPERAAMDRPVADPTRTTDRSAVHARGAAGEELFALALRLPGEGMPAATVLKTLERLAFEPGERQIYHRPGADGAPLYSVADLFEPGILHPLPEAATLRGLVFFFAAAPGPEASGRFDRMLGAARECAERFGARIEDGSHRPLTAARELELKLAAAGARSPP